jgi:NADPH-dependent glutamate synthase beta subunit-like oxidoreductase
VVLFDEIHFKRMYKEERVKAQHRSSDHLLNTTDMAAGLSLTQAVNEAARCHLCHDAPCSSACPAGTDPATFIRKLRLRNIKGAIRTVKENNILGGICAVVCPTEQLCQKACVAMGLDRAIDIGGIQRFLVEHGWSMKFNPLEKAPRKSGKVAVIGSGPAGLTCAAEVAKAGYEVTVFDSMERPGGILRYGVPSFRLNPGFLDRELKDLTDLGVKITCGKTIPEGGAEALLQKGFQAVFFAPGTWKAVEMDIPGMTLKNIVSARNFLADMRNGREKEIIKLVKGKNVAVYGGGSVAMDAATTAKALGANKVYVLYRRSIKEMPAAKHDLDMAMANFVIFKPMSMVTELEGAKGKLCGLKGIETDWKKAGDTSAANLTTVPGTEFSLRIDVFVTALGYTPESISRRVCSGISFNRRGLVETTKDGVSTKHPNIFAGGDIVRGPALVVDAVADGKAAGQKIVACLENRKGEPKRIPTKTVKKGGKQ